jgi:small subunit ribosomal protein S2
LAVLNIGLLDQRISLAANILADKKKILIVSRKENGFQPAKKFAEAVEGKAITGRFMPGSLTNPSYKEFYEPDILIVTDPLADKQAMKEAIEMRIPIIGMADTFNETSFLDLVIPCNNKGKKSLALIFWAIAHLINEKRGKEFRYTMEDFGYEVEK